MIEILLDFLIILLVFAHIGLLSPTELGKDFLQRLSMGQKKLREFKIVNLHQS